jgi:hypothetical protein
MKRHTAYATLAILAAGVALPLSAQAQNPREPGNVVGGGIAAAHGGGDNMTIVYSTAGAGAGGGTQAQTGRTARIAGNDGDSLQVQYLSPLPPGAGRNARLVTSGDGPEVVYLDR